MDNKSETAKVAPKKSWLFICARIVWLALLVILVLLAVALANGAFFSPIEGFRDVRLSQLTDAIAGIFAMLIIGLLFSDRLRRPTLFITACLVTLIALFYAEEDWRGKHDWNRFQREWAAKGVKWDWQSMIPPAVPDDQNFAMTPVVASGYSEILDASGHEKIPHDTNVVDRLVLMTENGGNINNLGYGGWPLGKRLNLIAYQDYYRTLAKTTNYFPTTPQPQSAAADVLLALSRYNDVIEDLRQAAKLPESRFPLEYDKDNLAAILLPQLAAMKRCTIILNLRAVAELQNNQAAAAAADMGLNFRIMAAIHSEPFLISQLVRIAELRLDLQPVWEGLADHRWSDEQLVAFNTELAKLDFVSDYNRAMHTEMLFQSWAAGYVRSHPEALNDYSDDRSPSKQVVEFAARAVPAGWFDQNRLQAAQVMLKYYIRAADLNHATFSPAILDQGVNMVKEDSTTITPFKVLESFMLGGLYNCGEKFAFAQASVSMARIAIALERYRLANGNYPASLDALVPQFLVEIPHDVIDGQPFHYRLEANGQFTLYSVGWNEKDDGGTTGPRKDSDSKTDWDEGDWVWSYPVQK